MFCSCIDWLVSWPVLLLGLPVAYFTYMCWHFRHFSRQGIPVEGKPVPVFGTSLPVFKEGYVRATEGNIEKLGKTYGGFSGRLPYLATVDPDILREVFIKDIQTYPNRFTFQTGDPLDDNMVQAIMDYAHWRGVRGTMTPAFSSGKLKAMMPQMNKCASTYAGHLVREAEGGKSLEMKEFASSFVMDAIASTAFGLDVNTQEDRSNPFVMSAQKTFNVKMSSPLILAHIFMPFLMPVLKLFKFSFFNQESKDFFTDITNQTLKARKESKDDRVDFLNLMMKAHEEDDTREDGPQAEDRTDQDQDQDDTHVKVPGSSKKQALTRQELVSQAVLFFLAGYETTATTISFLCYNLAMHPEAQDKLIDEVLRVMGEDNNVNDQQLQAMPYLDMCVSESLRLYPPAVRTDRQPSKDVQVHGIHMPAGSLIIAPIYHMHRLPDIYPDPDNFIPERFSPEEKAKRDPMLYMPFGAGPRMCIARRLALLEVKLAIVHVLRTHRFVRAPDTQIPLEFCKQGSMLKPEKGIWLRLEEHGRN